MNHWIMSANKKYYYYHKAFDELAFIDWKEGNRNFNIGDIIYIYSTKPIARIEYKCEVTATKIKNNESINDRIYWNDNSIFGDVNNTFIRLKKLKHFNTDLLSFKNLTNNGLRSVPLSPVILANELFKYIKKIETCLVDDYINTKKKFLLVDHGSGSYNVENKGFELFNESANPLDSKYYAYVPPYSTLDITKLGASKNDKSVSDVVVIFVTKINEDSTDRIITGLYPYAKIYSKPISGEKLQRTFVDKNGSVKSAPYSIKSDSYLPLGHLSLIIKTKQYNNYLFRGQRVYCNTNNELDKKIYSLLDYIFNEINEKEDIDYQYEVLDSFYAKEEDIINASTRKVEIITTNNGKRVKRNPSLAKTAIAKKILVVKWILTILLFKIPTMNNTWKVIT